jgi:predicted ATPase
MRVKEITVKDYRGIKDATLQLEEDLTVLIGVNGSGKSALLRAILFPLKKLVGLGPLSAESDDISVGEHECSIKATMAWDGQQALEDQTVLARVPHGGVGMQVELNAQAGEVKFGSAFLIRNYPAARASAAGPWVHGKPSGVVPQRLPEAAADAIAPVQRTYNHFFTWFKEREDVENQNRVRDRAALDPQLEAVREAIRAWEGYENLRVEREENRIRLDKNGTSLTLTQLSDGERAVLLLLADLARAAASTAPGKLLHINGVVLIDEVDAHLHPKWQRDILPALRKVFPNIQFIVTTHSPLVLSEIEARNVRILKRYGETLEFLTPAYSRGRDVNLLLEGLMEATERPKQQTDDIAAINEALDRQDLAAAKAAVARLATVVGRDDPAVARAETEIFLIGKKNATRA